VIRRFTFDQPRRSSTADAVAINATDTTVVTIAMAASTPRMPSS